MLSRRKAIEIEPNELAGYIFLGACQARHGKLQEAEATFLVAFKETESSLLDEAYHNLGLVCRGQGRLAEAAERFRRAIELAPEYGDACRNEIRRFVRAGSAAFAHLRRMPVDWPKFKITFPRGNNSAGQRI